MPVLQLLFLYELGALGVGQLTTEELGLKQFQEMQALGVSVEGGRRGGGRWEVRGGRREVGGGRGRGRGIFSYEVHLT